MSVKSSERASCCRSFLNCIPQDGFHRLGIGVIGGLWAISNVYSFSMMKLLSTTLLGSVGLYAFHRTAHPHKGDTFVVAITRDLEQLIISCYGKCRSYCSNNKSTGGLPKGKATSLSERIDLKGADVSITKTTTRVPADRQAAALGRTRTTSRS